MLARPRRGRACSSLVALVLAVSAGGCGDDVPSVPSKLIDGSPARPPPVVLEGIDGPTIFTRVRVRRGDDVPTRSRSASCIASIGGSADGKTVERVGVSGMSVTFLGPGHRSAHACDGVDRVSGGQFAWCGQAYGRIENRKPGEPRLSLSCSSSGGNPVGFAWVQPSAVTSYVVVHEQGYAEAYVVANGVPVRMTTSDVDVTTSTAALSITEHARDGHRVGSYVVSAQVAG